MSRNNITVPSTPLTLQRDNTTIWKSWNKIFFSILLNQVNTLVRKGPQPSRHSVVKPRDLALNLVHRLRKLRFHNGATNKIPGESSMSPQMPSLATPHFSTGLTPRQSGTLPSHHPRLAVCFRIPNILHLHPVHTSLIMFLLRWEG